MPSPIVWSSRRPLYKLTLVVLIAVAPVNLLSLVLPHWLRTKAVVTYQAQGKESMKDVVLSYGIWRLCSDTFGCREVHDANTAAGIGAWMYPIKLFMVLSLLCHVFAVTCGVMQNFVRRDQLRRFRWTLWKKIVHRDCPYAEDVGFIAGFMGTLSCIIFMLGTKDRMSDGAHYEWGFACAFMSSTLTVLATLTLTKTHILTLPRPPSNTNRRNGFHSDPSDSGRDQGAVAAAAASSSPRREDALRPEDIRLEERQQAAQAEASSSSRQSGAQPNRRRRSRSRSRSRDRQSSGRQTVGHVLAGQSRLTRSPELENIPAAVAPSEPSFPAVSALSSGRSRTAPVMCLEMSDLQSRAVSPPLLNHTARTTSKQPSPASSTHSPGEPSTPGSSKNRIWDSSGKMESGAQSSNFHRTQSEAVVVPPSDNSTASAQGHNPVVHNRRSTHDDSPVTESVDVESHRL